MSEISISKNIGAGIEGSVGIGAPKNSADAIRNREQLSTDFRNTLRDTINGAPTAARPTVTPGSLGVAGSAVTENLKFSAHAVDRMKSRGISFAPDVMKGIESAVARAAAKGSRDTLVLTGDNALIVSVKNNTVVTVMDRAAMRENVFTNIDSTVMV